MRTALRGRQARMLGQKRTLSLTYRQNKKQKQCQNSTRTHQSFRDGSADTSGPACHDSFLPSEHVAPPRERRLLGGRPASHDEVAEKG